MRIIYHHNTLSRYRDICFRTSTSRYYTSISAVRSFSTHTANDDVDTNKQLPNNNRVPKALYRQLLAWSRRYRDVPFTNLPPVTLTPPQVNPIALKRLKDMRTFLLTPIRKDAMKITGKEDNEETIWRKVGAHPSNYALYNEDIEIKDNDMITFPQMKDVTELQAVIKSIYWLNNEHTIKDCDTTDVDNNESTKAQISLAFEAIKSCNELSSGELDSRGEKREYTEKVRKGVSIDDALPNVSYQVGQVIQHTKEKWRGVIVGWGIEKDKNPGKLSSLTTKQYSLKQEDDVHDDTSTIKRVQYTILVDIHDSNLLQSSKTVTLEFQDDLSPIDDPCLQRIHNALIKKYFESYRDGHFEPNNILSYMYPLDEYSHCKLINDCDEEDKESRISPELEKSSTAITQGVQEISRHLLVPLLSSELVQEQKEEDEDDASRLLVSLRSDVLSMSVEDSSIMLAKLYHLRVKINALLYSRSANQKRRQEHNIQYKLGDIVRHKIYGFRGVVSEFDATPRWDVSNWDGLTHIENPNQKPFYAIYPDTNDCIDAFGSPRNWRYVCQDNLELCPQDKPLELEFDEWKFNEEKGSYTPSAEMKFMYGEDIGRHETELISIIQNMKEILNECLLKIREDRSFIFSMDDLFFLLQQSASLDDATVIQDLVREIWKESSNSDLRDKLDQGIADMLEGKHESALQSFTNVVAIDPSYSEAWNKKSTVHYMLDQLHNSIEAADKALSLDKRNFQALAGRGLLEMDASRYDKAIESFRKCLEINPWMGTVSARLAMCIELEKGNESKPLPNSNKGTTLK